MASPLQRFNVSSACGAERLIVVHGLSKGLWHQVTCSATVLRFRLQAEKKIRQTKIAERISQGLHYISVNIGINIDINLNTNI